MCNLGYVSGCSDACVLIGAECFQQCLLGRRLLSLFARRVWPCDWPGLGLCPAQVDRQLGLLP